MVFIIMLHLTTFMILLIHVNNLQVLEIKQELHDESVYHDAISDLLSDEEASEVGSSRTRKR